jgi:hypothetical protein
MVRCGGAGSASRQSSQRPRRHRKEWRGGHSAEPPAGGLKSVTLCSMEQDVVGEDAHQT